MITQKTSNTHSARGGKIGWPCCLVSIWLGLQLLCAASTAVGGDTGLIWRVSNGSHQSYLLGALHFADSSFYPLPEHILQAYHDSEVLLVEVDERSVSPEQQQGLIVKHGHYPAGQSLSQQLKPATLAQIKQLLAEFQLPLASVEHYRPGLLAVSIAALQAQRLGYHAEQGLDNYFMQKARYRKPIRQIENFEFQMALLRAMPEDDASLQASFKGMKGYAEQWHGMMAAWKHGDAHRLYQIAIGDSLAEHPELEVFYDTLFFQRHLRMVAATKDCIERQEVCFIVVGAGHLVGEQGMLQILKQQGYQLQQLRP